MIETTSAAIFLKPPAELNSTGRAVARFIIQPSPLAEQRARIDKLRTAYWAHLCFQKNKPQPRWADVAMDASDPDAFFDDDPILFERW